MLARGFVEKRDACVVEPVSSVEYKGFEVRLFVWLAVRESTCTAMYEIPDYERSHRAVVVGKFRTANTAEAAALESAKRWIDENAG